MDQNNKMGSEDIVSLVSSQFKSEEIEHDFRQHQLDEDKKIGLLVISLAIIGGIVLSYVDYQTQGFSEFVKSAVAGRFILVIVCIGALFLILKTENENNFDLIIFLFAGSIALINAYIGSLRPSGYISMIVFEVIMIIVFYLVLPTRLVFKIIPSMAVTILSQNVRTTEILMLHHLISHTIGIIFTSVLNRSKRVQFSQYINEIKIKKDLEKTEQEILFISGRLASQNKELKGLATKDPLTGINNRRSLYKFAEEQWSRAVRNDEECSIIIIDIDHFKKINDTYGHLTGDTVLKEVTKAIDMTNRSYDRFGRWGGEEFILYLPDTNVEHAEKIAERIRDMVSKMSFQTTNGTDITITVSIGVSSKSISKTIELDVMLDHADKALYSAKNAGRNRVSIFKDA